MKRISILLLSISALFLFTGCFDPFFVYPYFAVEDSGLNWIEIYSRQPTGKNLTRVRIDGSGIVKIRTGSSPLVGDAFAKDTTNEYWTDIHNDQITIPRDDVVKMFQELVNNGLFKEQIKGEDDPPLDDIIMVFGNIQNHTVKANVLDPVLHEHLKSLVLLFNRPRQRR